VELPDSIRLPKLVDFQTHRTEHWADLHHAMHHATSSSKR
jgi:hypothetical protein